MLLAALAGAGQQIRSARNSAAQQHTAEVSERLAAQSAALEATDPVTAALLAGAAWRISPTAQARYSLLESLAQPMRGTLAAQSGLVTAVAYSPDGKTMAAGYSDGTIRLWDTASHRLISTASWGRGSACAGVHRRRQDPGGSRSSGRWSLGFYEPGPGRRTATGRRHRRPFGRVQPGRHHPGHRR
jgi:WD domain, G-beta repeat